MLYLIEILHQTTTKPDSPVEYYELYLIEILHQTTTADDVVPKPNCCILSKFYIKPQQPYYLPFCCVRCILSKFYIKPQRILFPVYRVLRCILSKFYIKPQPGAGQRLILQGCILSKFYIKPQRRREENDRAAVVSYRNSTSNHNTPAAVLGSSGLYLIEILHQTTTIGRNLPLKRSCILSKFYIKPQRRASY